MHIKYLNVNIYVFKPYKMSMHFGLNSVNKTNKLIMMHDYQSYTNETGQI